MNSIQGVIGHARANFNKTWLYNDHHYFTAWVYIPKPSIHQNRLAISAVGNQCTEFYTLEAQVQGYECNIIIIYSENWFEET